MSEKVTNLSEYRAGMSPIQRPPLKGGGGDGTFDDMEPRVAVLEKAVERIEKTLDRIDAKLDKVSGDVSEMKGALPALARASDVSAVAASLKDKPSTWQAVIISLAISGLTVAAALGGAAKLLAK